MGALALALAWVLSLLPLGLDALTDGELGVRGASRLGLTLLPWLALAGLPRARDVRVAASWTAVPFLALPPVALGAALDLGARGAGELAWAALAGLALVVLLSWSARRGGARRAVAWLGLVVLPPVLCTAFALTTAGGTAPPLGALVWVTERTPLGWAWTGARPESTFPFPVGPLLVALLLCAASLAPAAEGEDE